MSGRGVCAELSQAFYKQCVCRVGEEAWQRLGAGDKDANVANKLWKHLAISLAWRLNQYLK